MADNQFPDLGITQQQDGEYWNITIPSLETSTTYGFRFAWVFPDDSVSEFSDVFEVTTPAAVFQEVANLQAEWVGSSLKVTFDRTSDEAKNYQIVFAPLIPLLPTVSPLRVTQAMDDSQTQQTYILTLEKNKRNFLNVFRKQFILTVQTTYLDGTSQGVTITTPMYEDKICTNTILDSQWSVVSTLLKTQDNSYGFLVTWKDDSPKEDTYNQTRVYMSDSPTGPWTLEYTGKGPAEIGPILDFNIHYIKINHQSISGCESGDSSVKQVKAIDLINFKDYPPDEFTNVTSAWVQNPNTLNDLKITFNLPAANPQKKENIGKKARVYFTVQKDGVDTEEFIDRTFSEPFTHGAQKTITIFADEIRARFLSYNPVFLPVYSNKKGRISSIDQYDNVSPGVPFDIGARVNPLSNHTPTILVTEVENGYSVKNTNTKSEINYYEVYASKDNNTFSKVYSGILPAFILDISYTLTYVKVIGITLAGDASNESSVSTVTPLSVAEMSLIEFPVGLGTEGSIWSGPLQDSDNDGEPDKDENGNLIPISEGARAFFNRRGFFVYDKNGVLTTQIIGDGTLYNNPYAGTGGSLNPNYLTFITKSAQIANWRVSTDRIENTLSELDPNTYTGMSGAGNYAFWAGSDTTGNLNGLALFSVTHAGKVVASNIDVLGGKLRVGGTTDALAPFLVTSSGLLTAAGATINGTINAVSGKMGEIDIGGTMKVLDQNPLSPTFGKYVDKHVDGQLRITADNGSKIEMGKLGSPADSNDFTAEQNAILEANAGIQITSGSNKYVQLDSLNGILANRGYIGGWRISKNEISYKNNMGFYSGAGEEGETDPKRIWAGAGRDATVVPFYVTEAGNVFASNAILAGKVQASSGGFGSFTGNTNIKPGDNGYVEKGWLIDQATIKSTGEQDMGQIVLDGENATISGGWIYGSVFWLQYPDANGDFTKTGDYISSDGDFNLGNGNINYSTATGLSIGTAAGDTNVYFQNVDFYMGSKSTNSMNKFLKNGYFSIGNGTLRYDDTTGSGNYGSGTYTPPGGSAETVKALLVNASNIKLTDYSGTLRSNRNGNAAERTLAVDDNGFITSARRFIYEGTTEITNSGTKFGSSVGTDLWTWNGVNFVGPVGVGDIVMVGDTVLI